VSEMTIEHESVAEPVGVATSDEQLIAMLVDRARSEGMRLTGAGGLLQRLTKRVLESALKGEITDHLGYDKHDPAGKNSGNSRNGTRGKTVLTDVGPVEVKVPRDVEGSFEPQIVRKRRRPGVDKRCCRCLRRASRTGRSPRTWRRSTVPRSRSGPSPRSPTR
jgi:putative transposase